MLVASVIGEIETTFFNRNLRQLLFVTGTFEFFVLRKNFILVTAIVVISKLKKDEPEDRSGVFARFQI